MHFTEVMWGEITANQLALSFDSLSHQGLKAYLESNYNIIIFIICIMFAMCILKYYIGSVKQSILECVGLLQLFLLLKGTLPSQKQPTHA